MNLDAQGRCCGRKPIRYKGGSWRSPARPQWFCARCNRAYDLETGKQFENWAWRELTPGIGIFDRRPVRADQGLE